jgi:hypothetical protein
MQRDRNRGQREFKFCIVLGDELSMKHLEMAGRKTGMKTAPGYAVLSLRSSQSRGFSMLEVILSTAIFTGLAAVAWFSLTVAVRVWGSAGGRDDAGRILTKSWSLLRADLVNARLSAGSFAFASSPPSSLGGGRDGDALCFLTPLDPDTGALATRPDGTPFMLRNVIYYVSVPTTHRELFGAQCAGGADSAGYEVQCPHKMLLRRVVDDAKPTAAGDASNEEALHDSWESLLTRPAGLTSSDSALKIIATNILSFRCRQEGPALRLDMYATAIPEARRNLALGAVPLDRSPYTLRQTTTVYPQN